MNIEEKIIVYLDEGPIEGAMKLLKRKDVDVNYQDNSGKTLLMHACLGEMDKGCDHEFSELLFEKKDLDVTLEDDEGNTALTYACEKDDHYFVSSILDKDSKEFFHRNKKGDLPMKIAVKHENFDLMEAFEEALDTYETMYMKK